MDDVLMSIGVFARRVGLAPSALRFYDDCGLLRPARVDEATGYRYYAPGQERRAVLVRRLRDAGVPLPEASVVLDGAREEARAVLERHARRTREAAEAARAVVEELLGGLAGGPDAARARVGGAELAGAVRQVAAAAARGDCREEFPVLGCVLLELDGQEVRLAATDRYRLAVRTLRADSASGGPCRVPVPVEDMREAASWALPLDEVGIEVDGRQAWLLDASRPHDGSGRRKLPATEEVFPSYRMILDEMPPARHRVITARGALAAALAEPGDDGPVLLRTGGNGLAVGRPGRADAELPAVCTGPPARISFDPAVLLPALEAGVGPDVLLEVSSPNAPVVVRSADQGSFTTLVMPVFSSLA
ncbi:MerR family transcriptional regulator [Actinocorallia sp. B10E7]|uniref:DNA polymerase III subunit beta family protein n=1 Tax=Actinocorallia sp. B10E7 TaxID=3153558 RepID=UPI00325E813E